MKVDSLIKILELGNFEQQNVRVSVIDENACFRYTSTTLIGFNQDHIGTSVYDYYSEHVTDEQIKGMKEAIEKTLNGEIDKGVIILQNRLNQKVIHWDYEMTPFIDEDGGRYIISVIKPREILLSETSTNFFIKEMVEQGSDTFTVFNEELEFVYVSKKMATWGDKPIVGCHISEVLTGENLEIFKKRVRDAQANPGEIITNVVKIRVPNYGEAYFESSMEFHDFGDLGHFFLDRISDVTEKYGRNREIETQKMAIDKMSKWTALGQMAANIAHEVNNPLAIIELQIQSIEKRGKDLCVEDIMGKVRSIADQKNRIANIVSSLNIYSHDNKSVREAVALSSIVHDSIALFKTRLVDDDLKIVFSNEGDTDLVMVNSSEIIQVLINLLNNAYDAIAHLDEKWIELNLDDDNDFVSLDVLDSGHGIDDEVAKNIFERFYTTKSKDKGTGLGLNISQEIIADHGGKLIYEPNSEYTTFNIRLPKVALS